jgi:hypothetical protein
MTLTITFTLLLIGLLFWGSLPYLSYFSKRKIKNLFRQLNIEGAKNNLIFCSQDLFDNMIIGFDGIHRKVLILERNKKQYFSKIISLDEVTHCQLLTEDGMHEPGDFKKLDQQIGAGILELHFEFKNHQEAASIIFNDTLQKSAREFALLKAKAEYWCVMFSKMLNHRLSVRA